jgi:phage-related baseplate assembly protein
MINIENLPKPNVLQVLDYEAILNQNIDNFKTLVPDWQPLESDEFSLILQAFAYRELHLRAEFNNLASAFFLSTTTGANLDNYALFYGVERLQGSKPYATYEFSLSDTFASDMVIPKNLVLTDETSTYEARLLSDVVIAAGTDKATGTVELQLETKSSEVKTEIITTPLPFVVEAKAQGDFTNGSNPESDEELRDRILLSMADKSTAGSEETYKSFTFNADKRVEDVAVLNGGDGVVNVFYYSPSADDLMQTRIVEKLNAKDVRPLSDNVVVSPATQVPFSITAELKILPNQETATVLTNATKSLEDGLKSLKQIGTDITLSEINDFLKVTGVKEVVISSPSSNVVIDDNEIGVNSVNTITYTII